VEGLSVAETARRMQCAEGTVKASLHQATRKLREHLKEAGA
jgi:DNA-directed RNA polymerase specialized sigma24 family protein